LKSLPLGALLIKLRDATGSSRDDSHRVDLSGDEYDFRLTNDGEIEALLDAASLCLPDLGTAVVVLDAARIAETFVASFGSS
jgi:hypothetical protein